MENLNLIIGNNIAFYRKHKNLTQAELADILNYSDKSISKWERGEGLPSVIILKELADFFEITLNDLIVEGPVKIKKKRGPNIAYFYALLVMVVGVVAYGVLSILNIKYPTWQIVVYAIPFSMLVMMVFSIVQKKFLKTIISFSLFIWTLSLSLYLAFPINNGHWIFIITAPVCLIIIYLFYLLLYKKRGSIKR